MTKQYDTFLKSYDGKSVSIGCYCGAGWDHGALEFYYNPDIDLSDTFADHDIQACWLSVRLLVAYHQTPVLGSYTLGKWVGRLRAAWSALTGHPVDLDYNLSAKTVKDLGQWLYDSYCESEKLWQELQKKQQDDTPKIPFRDFRVLLEFLDRKGSQGWDDKMDELRKELEETNETKTVL